MIFRHFKGNMYELVCIGKHSETLEEYVVYRSLEEDKYWVRPSKMFFEDVFIDGKWIPRFAKVDD